MQAHARWQAVLVLVSMSALYRHTPSLSDTAVTLR
jgi:hypothetical protein